jgi:hypothetical protein
VLNIRDVPPPGVVDYGSLAAHRLGSKPPMPVRETLAEHAPENAMVDLEEIARFYDRCSDLMRALLDELASVPDRPRPFPAIEDALGWPHRRIASVLGGVCHLRRMEFAGRRPYHFAEPRNAASGRWEMWMDGEQARAARIERDYR